MTATTSTLKYEMLDLLDNVLREVHVEGMIHLKTEMSREIAPGGANGKFWYPSKLLLPENGEEPKIIRSTEPVTPEVEFMYGETGLDLARRISSKIEELAIGAGRHTRTFPRGYLRANAFSTSQLRPRNGLDQDIENMDQKDWLFNLTLYEIENPNG